MFSRAREQFVLIDESSVEELESEARDGYVETRSAIAQN